MKAFADLYTALDETTKTTEKVDALTRYFAAAPAGRRRLGGLLPDRPEAAAGRPLGQAPRLGGRGGGRPRLALQESYDAVGDVAETIALLLPDARRARATCPLHDWVEDRLLPLRKAGEDGPARGDARRPGRAWTGRQRFVWNKLISGGFRVGVSQQLVTRALGKVSGIDADRDRPPADGRLGARRPPSSTGSTPSDAADADLSRPYPFFLAYAAGSRRPRRSATSPTGRPNGSGTASARSSSAAAGRPSSGRAARSSSPSATPSSPPSATPCPTARSIDGEILPWKDGAPLPFAQLQRRIGRKTVGKAILAEVPVVLMAYDLLEHDGADVRAEPLEWRRARLAEIVAASDCPTPVRALADRRRRDSWDDLAAARAESRDAAGRGADAQAARLALRRRPAAGRLVEVEGQPAHRRRRPDRRPARQRQAGEPLHRLHLRRLGRAAGSSRSPRRIRA